MSSIESLEVQLKDEDATIALGKKLGVAIQKVQASLKEPTIDVFDDSKDTSNTESVGAELRQSNVVIYMDGVLGAGKTTFCRGVLTSLGHQGHVKSPTYTLVEPYSFSKNEEQSLERSFYHFDLYRLRHSEELEDLAFRDYLDGSGVCLIEWPERGLLYLPSPDCLIDIEYENDGRCFKMQCATELGSRLCASLR